jgi:hypothetical protein
VITLFALGEAGANTPSIRESLGSHFQKKGIGFAMQLEVQFGVVVEVGSSVGSEEFDSPVEFIVFVIKCFSKSVETRSNSFLE